MPQRFIKVESDGDLPNPQGAQEQEASYPDTKFIKFFERLYAAVFALFAITALSVFVLPENILDVSGMRGLR